MNPYRHLLCPVDFSDASRKALEWSSRFSKEIGARLTVLHVLDTALLSVGNLVAAPDIFAELRRRTDEGFAPLKKELDLKHAKFEFEEGVPEDVIVNAATERGADLVVMGTHGLSGFEKFFLGSVTEKVLHRARVPLLTLSPSVEAQRTAGSRGAGREVLMAVDLGPESQAVVRHGVWLAEHFRAKPVALHAVARPYVILNEASFEPLGQMEVERLMESLTAARRKDLEAILPESESSPIEAIVTVGSAFESLRGIVEERPVDLVVMGAGDHGEAGIRWLGSTCHKMVRWAPCPVMVVR
jgi:nucleotide-binding universal stress UspA family protein